MLKFIFGVLFGAGLAFGYVRYQVELPEFMQLPDMLRGNLVTSAVESDLYDLDAALDVRRRALEIYLANRPERAVEIDGSFGHPFLEALYRHRAIREARLLKGQWSAFDMALGKPELRQRLEAVHGTADSETLKRKMLLAALGKSYPFLGRWLTKAGEPNDEARLLDTVTRLARLPDGRAAGPGTAERPGPGP